MKWAVNERLTNKITKSRTLPSLVKYSDPNVVGSQAKIRILPITSLTYLLKTSSAHNTKMFSQGLQKNNKRGSAEGSKAKAFDTSKYTRS